MLEVEVSSNVVIIGAGLAGLTCAMKLAKKGVTCTVVDARSRLGGRILSKKSIGAIDLGPAWTWPSNDLQLESLTNELGISQTPQRNNGKDLRAPGMAMQTHWEVGTNRFQPHGTMSLIEALGNTVADIRLNTVAEAIKFNETNSETISVILENAEKGKVELKTRAVVVAAPPRIIRNKIEFTPELPKPVKDAMDATPTWMSDTMKVVAVFSTCFWEENGLSGAAFPGGGVLGQIWDNSWTSTTENGEQKNWYALGGFILGEACKRLYGAEEEEVKRVVTEELEKFFGPKVRSELVGFVHKNWLEDDWVNTKGVQPRYTHGFGDPILRQAVFSGRLVFAGTETENEHGHMEGAVRSGVRASNEILETLKLS